MPTQVSEKEALQMLAQAVIQQTVRDFFYGHAFSLKPYRNTREQLAAFEALHDKNFMTFWGDLAGKEFDANVLLDDVKRGREALGGFQRDVRPARRKRQEARRRQRQEER